MVNWKDFCVEKKKMSQPSVKLIRDVTEAVKKLLWYHTIPTTASHEVLCSCRLR